MIPENSDGRESRPNAELRAALMQVMLIQEQLLDERAERFPSVRSCPAEQVAAHCLHWCAERVFANLRFPVMSTWTASGPQEIWHKAL